MVLKGLRTTSYNGAIMKSAMFRNVILKNIYYPVNRIDEIQLCTDLFNNGLSSCTEMYWHLDGATRYCQRKNPTVQLHDASTRVKFKLVYGPIAR